MSSSSSSSSSGPRPPGPIYSSPSFSSPVSDLQDSGDNSIQSSNRLDDSISLLKEINEHLMELQAELKEPTVKQELKQKFKSLASMGSAVGALGKVSKLPELGAKTAQLGSTVYESGISLASAGATYATGGAVISTVTGLFNLLGIVQAKGVKQNNQNKVQNFQIRLEQDIKYLNTFIADGASLEQMGLERQARIQKWIADFYSKPEVSKSIPNSDALSDSTLEKFDANDQIRYRGAISNLDSLFRDIDSTQKKLEEIFGRILDLHTSLSSLHSGRKDHFTSLPAQLKDLIDNFEQIESNKSYKELQLVITNLQQYCENLLKTLTEINYISHQINVTQAQLKSLIPEGESLEQKLQSHFKQIIENKNTINEIALKSKSNQNEILNTRVKSLEETLQADEMRLAQHAQKIDDLEAQIKSCTEAQEQNKALNSQLLASLNTQLIEARSAMENYSQEARQNATQFDQVARGLVQTSLEFKKLQDEIAYLQECQTYVDVDLAMLPDDRPQGAWGKWMKVLFDAQSTGWKSLIPFFRLPSYTAGIAVIDLPGGQRIKQVDFRKNPPLSEADIQGIAQDLTRARSAHPQQVDEIIAELTTIPIQRRTGVHLGLIPADLLNNALKEAADANRERLHVDAEKTNL